MFCSGAITAVRSAGIAWIKPSSVFDAIEAPSEGVIDVLLVRSRTPSRTNPIWFTRPWGAAETEIFHV